jgi:hypothetical protein
MSVENVLVVAVIVAISALVVLIKFEECVVPLISTRRFAGCVLTPILLLVTSRYNKSSSAP